MSRPDVSENIDKLFRSREMISPLDRTGEEGSVAVDRKRG